MTPLSLAPLKALYEKATKGEWCQNAPVTEYGNEVYLGNETICITTIGANAALIVALHNSFPALLREARDGMRYKEALEEISLLFPGSSAAKVADRALADREGGE